MAGGLQGLIGQRDPALVIGAALSVLWLMLMAVLWLAAPADASGGGASGLVTAIAVLMPLALIWMAVTLARAIAALRAEAAQLRAQLAAMRATNDEARPFAQPSKGAHSPAQAQAQAQAPATQPAPRAPAPPAPQPAPQPTQQPANRRPPARAAADARQPQLFDAPAQPADLPLPDLWRALNFPDGPQDQAAIRSLRLALQNPELSRLLRAAQDVVTLLAQRGLYMDDLPDDAARRPDLWRRFAAGERGAAVAPLGAALDEASLDIAGAMMRGDEVFRDVAHHFLRHFDRLLTARAPELDDDALAGFADTRSARAFALLARVTGMLG